MPKLKRKRVTPGTKPVRNPFTQPGVSWAGDKVRKAYEAEGRAAQAREVKGGG